MVWAQNLLVTLTAVVVVVVKGLLAAIFLVQVQGRKHKTSPAPDHMMRECFLPTPTTHCCACHVWTTRQMLRLEG